MNETEFLTALREIKDVDWWTNGNVWGERLDDHLFVRYFCPLTAVYNNISKNNTYLNEWDSAARSLNINDELAETIKNASDGDLETYSEVQMRVKLCKAIGRRPFE